MLNQRTKRSDASTVTKNENTVLETLVILAMFGFATSVLGEGI